MPADAGLAARWPIADAVKVETTATLTMETMEFVFVRFMSGDLPLPERHCQMPPARSCCLAMAPAQ
jgi:hypothetical protein